MNNESLEKGKRLSCKIDDLKRDMPKLRASLADDFIARAQDLSLMGTRQSEWAVTVPASVAKTIGKIILLEMEHLLKEYEAEFDQL